MVKKIGMKAFAHGSGMNGWGSALLACTVVGLGGCSPAEKGAPFLQRLAGWEVEPGVRLESGESAVMAASRGIASAEDFDLAVARIADASILGERYLADFDRQLESPDGAAGALESESYARLQAVRMIREEQVNRLEALSHQRNSPLRELFKNILSRKERAEGRTAATPFDGDTLRAAEVRLALMGEGELLREFGAEPENPEVAAALQRWVRREALTSNSAAILENPGIADEIDSLAGAWRAGRNAGRDPQSAPQGGISLIRPDAGRDGNVIGTEYPKGTWSITFDDGPSGNPQHTPTVIASLNEFGYKATFFQLAQMLREFPEQGKALQSLGMDLADHSWTHAKLPEISSTALNHEVVDSAAEQKRFYGTAPRLFRIPYGYGATNSRIRSLIASQNMVHVFWNVDTLDWKDRDYKSVAARALAQVKSQGRGIILFHDIHLQSPKAAWLVMDYLSKQADVRVVTVQQAIDEINAARSGASGK